jgi:hypothetical protein
MYTTNSFFIRKLTETKLNDVDFLSNNYSDTPYLCNRYENVLTIWKELIERRQLSSPVVTSKSGKFVGFIDMADIVLKFTEKITNKDENYDYYSLLENDENFKNLKCWQITNEKRNPRYFSIIF